MSVEISAENRQEYQAWTPVEEDLEGLPKNIHDLILQMRVDCSTTDRNRMPYYGADDDIDKFTNIPYIDDGTRAHQLDIYIPHDAIMLAVHNLPVYIDVHGGGFVYGYKELNRNFCIALARRGFAVISISYRVYPQADFLGQLQDVNAAISWLQNHADEYPIDPNRMGITGDSAGGVYPCTRLQSNPTQNCWIGKNWDSSRQILSSVPWCPANSISVNMWMILRSLTIMSRICFAPSPNRCSAGSSMQPSVRKSIRSGI